VYNSFVPFDAIKSLHPTKKPEMKVRIRLQPAKKLEIEVPTPPQPQKEPEFRVILPLFTFLTINTWFLATWIFPPALRCFRNLNISSLYDTPSSSGSYMLDCASEKASKQPGSSS
jgi:hypothetical protein